MSYKKISKTIIDSNIKKLLCEKIYNDEFVKSMIKENKLIDSLSALCNSLKINSVHLNTDNELIISIASKGIEKLLFGKTIETYYSGYFGDHDCVVVCNKSPFKIIYISFEG